MKICPRCMKKLNNGDPVVDVQASLNLPIETVHAFTCVREHDLMEYPNTPVGWEIHRSGGVPMYPFEEKEVSKDGYHNPYGDPREE